MRRRPASCAGTGLNAPVSGLIETVIADINASGITVVTSIGAAWALLSLGVAGITGGRLAVVLQGARWYDADAGPVPTIWIVPALVGLAFRVGYVIETRGSTNLICSASAFCACSPRIFSL